jgi:hypothetical protein
MRASLNKPLEAAAGKEVRTELEVEISVQPIL